MGFERPFLLVLLPMALVALLWKRDSAALPMAALVASAPSSASWRERMLHAVPLLGLLAASCAAVAASGPYLRARSFPDERQARDVALVVDASESMKAVDFTLDGRTASRMEAALDVAGEFIRGRRGDRIAVVAFGSRAVTQCPLTFDADLAAALLSYLRPEALGRRTALGEGLALGVARLPRGGALVLISDGQSTAGALSPDEAVRAAVERGVRIYSIGIGGPGPAPIPARMPSGAVRIVEKDYALDEATLRRTAETTGGRLFDAADTDALSSALAAIDRLERRPTSAVRSVPERSLAPVLAATGAVLLAAHMLLSATVVRCAPRLA